MSDHSLFAHVARAQGLSRITGRRSFRTRLTALAAAGALLAGQFLTAVPSLPVLGEALAVPTASAQEAPCLDRISVQDSYALLKARNDLYFHRTIHRLNINDWFSVSDNRPWGDTPVTDIDLTETPKGLANPTTPVAVAAAGSNVYIHYNLLDMASQSWISLNSNKPWGNATVTAVGIAGNPANTSLRVVVAAGNSVYFLATALYNNPNSYLWVNVSDNRPWGANPVVDVDVTHDNRGMVLAANQVHLHGALTALGANNWVYARQTGAAPVGSTRGDIEFRPAILAKGSEVRYIVYPFPTHATNWLNISDNKPWGNATVDDVGVFFWTQAEPWQTPAIAMAIAGNKPYLHWHPDNVAFAGVNGNWLDSADNEPWFAANGPCSTVVAQPNVTLSKTGPASVTRGNVVTYALSVANTGNAAAANVTVTDTPPAGFTFVPASSDPACQAQGGQVTCTVASLAAGQTVTLSVSFNVPVVAGCATQTVTNSAVAQGSGTCQQGGNWAAQVVSAARGTMFDGSQNFPADRGTPADTLGPPSGSAVAPLSGFYSLGYAGDIVLRFTVPISNGPGADVRVFEASPADAPLESAQVFASQDGVAWTLLGTADNTDRTGTVNNTTDLDLGALPSATFIRIVDTTPRNAGSTEGFDLSGVQGIHCGGAGTASTAQTQLLCPQTNANLSVSKTGPSTAIRGTSVTYAVTVSNAGPDAAQNVVATDDVPAGLTFAQASGDGTCQPSAGTVTCQLGTLASGQSKTLQLTFTVDAVPANQQCAQTAIANVVTVRSDATDTQTGNNQASAATALNCPPLAPDLSVVKSGPSEAARGGQIQYLVSVLNNGFGPAQGVVLTDVIPTGLTYATADASCAVQGANVVCQLGTLNAGQSRNVLLTFSVPQIANCQAASVQNRATVTTSSTESDTTNNASATVTTQVNCTAVPQCRDGVDNDGDGAIDFPSDFSCSSAEDNDETLPKAQCQDNADNDGDGKTDAQDPGCHFDGDASNPATYNPQDNDEFNPGSSSSSQSSQASQSSQSSQQSQSSSSALPECRNLQDDDVDGAIDFPSDFSCSGPDDNDEELPKPQCQDGVDNDGDGKVDIDDPGCHFDGDATNPATYNPQDNNESNPAQSSASSATGTPQCRDNIDNDGDGALDFPQDFSCSHPDDDNETLPKAQCQDSLDNDFDTKTDAQDPGCHVDGNASNSASYNPQDNDEMNATASSSAGPVPECRDNQDNDGDGAMDFPGDFSCAGGDDDNETLPKAQCQDDVDNDGDGLKDFPADPGCSSKQDNDEFNPGSSAASSVQSSLSSSAGSSALSSSSAASSVSAAPGQSNVSILKTGPAQGLRGSPVLYTVKVHNAGPAAAADVRILDPIPLGVQFLPALSVGCVQTGVNAVCQIGALASGEEKTYTLAFQAPALSGCFPVTVINVATVQTSTSDPDFSDNISAAVQTQVTCPDQGSSSSAAQSSAPASSASSVVTPQCRDNVDNDGDGAMDFPSDFSCSSADDTDETLPRAQCQDGADNDNDGATDYPNDPGCQSRQDNDESNAAPVSSAASSQASQGSQSSAGPIAQCRDGLDNDGDGATDMGDFSCSQPDDNDEANPKAQCQNGIDDDGDGLVDLSDPGCSGTQDNAESNAAAVLTVAKSDGKSTVNAGEILTYSITVTNASQVAAANATAIDVLPGELQFLSASDGGTFNGNTVTWTGLNVPAHASRTLTVQARVNPAAAQGTTIRNTAIVGGEASQDVTVVENPVSQTGCIEVLNETFDPLGNRIQTAAQFSFTLDGTRTAVNNASGIARFDGVSAGTHTVTQTLPSAWMNLAVTPLNGSIQVSGGSVCVALVFKNRQNPITPAQQGTQPYGPYQPYPQPQYYQPDPYAYQSNDERMCKALMDKYGSRFTSSKKKKKLPKAIRKLLDNCEDDYEDATWWKW